MNVGETTHSSIAPASCPLQMAKELARLPDDQLLHERGDLLVARGTWSQVPEIVFEIGRLREIAFRAVGEGTGKATDLDAHDRHYQHLFVWSHSQRAILGAYRVAKTGEVLRQLGPQGLYTHTLFDFDDDFHKRLGPGLELGRSFVRPDQQRSSRVLAMLWRGIGRIVALAPEYSTLFGPVSVSALYTEESRRVIARVLSSGDYRHPLHAKVRALHPVRDCARPNPIQPDLKELSLLVSRHEPDGKGLPTLVKEYAKLGGRFLSFSIDPDFGAAMDGLVVVDLWRTDPRLLHLYMGPESYADFTRSRAVAPTVDEQPVV